MGVFMTVSDVCKSYFNGFQECFNLKNQTTTTNTLAVLKVLSYLVIVIPLGFAAVYGSVSLCNRVSKKEDLSSLDQDINEKAKEIILNRTQSIAVNDTGNAQPEIIADDWGRITLRLNGSVKLFKDVIILPSDDRQVAEEWNWRGGLEPMRHHPGIRINDVKQLILSKTPKPDVIILTQGRGHGGLRENAGPGILEVASGVREYIESQGVSEVYILKTAAAIEKYNEIRNQGTKRIAALIHTTC